MSKTIRPLHDHILLRLKERPTTTAGGLHMPERRDAHDDDTLVEARVLAVGEGSLERHKLAAEISNPGYLRDVMPVKAGDIVLVCQNALHHLELDGEQYEMVHVQGLFGVVEGN
jgi:co-chaperonin GroES (HSP10)